MTYEHTAWKQGDLARVKDPAYGSGYAHVILMEEPDDSGYLWVHPLGGRMPRIVKLDDLWPVPGDDGLWRVEPHFPPGDFKPDTFCIVRGDCEIAEAKCEVDANIIVAALNRVRPFAGEANQIEEGEAA